MSMKQLVLSVADHAYIDPATGKLYILGAFNRITAKKDVAFPLLHRVLTFVVKLGAEIGEIRDEHIISIMFAEEDGQEIFRIQQAFVFNKGTGGLFSEANIILEIRDIVFEHSGEYQFNVEVDDHFIGSTALVVTAQQE